MNNNINNLLEKYWNAESSLKEEAELRTYFASQDVSEEHLEYIDLFQHINDESQYESNLDVAQLFNTLNDIDGLLEKYWKAETTISEEEILKAYFTNNEIAPEHQALKSLFTYYEVASELTTVLNLSDAISSSNTDIDQILSQYWEAQTSLEDEAILKAYFMSNNVAQKHLEYKDLFMHFEVASQMTTGIDVSAILPTTVSIDEILTKYYSAETTLEEEAKLHTYFASDNISPSHEASRELFQYYAGQKNESIDIDLKSLFKNQEESGSAKSDKENAPKQSKTKVFNLRKMATAIAALFVLGFAAVTVMNQTSQPESKYRGKYVQLDEEAEAQEAYEITKQALALLSKNMNKGSKTVNKSVGKVKNASIFK